MEELIHKKLTGALHVQDGRSRCCSQLQLQMRQRPKELSDFPKVTRQRRVGWPQACGLWKMSAQLTPFLWLFFANTDFPLKQGSHL